MGKTLYLECSSGISGDMTVAALIDLGADKEKLKQTLASLPLDGYRTEITRVNKSGLDVCDFAVILEEDNHDHDMEYLHGHADRSHTHEHGHAEETHSHGHAHEHTHRGIVEIREIFAAARMTERAKNTALKIFEILAQAEAKAHGVLPEEVHFHEVGAVDSIVDIAAAAICLDDLDIEEVIIPRLCEGSGTVRCQHGIIPVPVPAVTAIAAAHGLNLRMTDIEGELVTPTGAAIAAAICTENRLPSDFRILQTGMGAGKRSYACPGILRAMLIEKTSVENDSVYCLQTDIDDSTGETLGYVLERLYDAGVREAHFTPVFMKKCRPAYELTVLCDENNLKTVENLIFRETTTIGIRKSLTERRILKREEKELETPIGMAQIKLCTLPDGNTKCYPEYESAAKLAKEKNLALCEVYEIILEAYRERRK